MIIKKESMKGAAIGFLAIILVVLALSWRPVFKQPPQSAGEVFKAVHPAPDHSFWLGRWYLPDGEAVFIEHSGDHYEFTGQEVSGAFSPDPGLDYAMTIIMINGELFNTVIQYDPVTNCVIDPVWDLVTLCKEGS